MKPDELRELIALPESDVLEFKSRLPSAHSVARIMSAFANTRGGVLVVGVEEGGEIIGVDDPVFAQKRLLQAIEKTSPPVAIQSEVITLEGKSVLVATIKKGQLVPHLVDGQAFQRKGDLIVRMSIYAPDAHSSAYRAVLSGSGAVAQGPGAVAAGEQGVVIETAGGDYVSGGVVADGDFIGRDQWTLITWDAAFERVIGSTAFVLNQLELSYRQTRGQSQGWFRFSLIAAGIGFVLIGVGVIAVIFGEVTAGLITTISSVIPNAAAALFFVQSKAANERVDAIQTRLTEARELQTAVEIANTVSDQKSRDGIKAEIVRKALRLEQGGRVEQD